MPGVTNREATPISTSASIVVDRDFIVSAIDRRIFGSFVEHMGRTVYGGIYEPGGKFSDDDGFRTDVVDLVRELGVTIVRYPGGNFLSGYDWRDGIGPFDERPQRLDLAWHALETNAFGTDEFMRWCALTGIEPMMAVNLGTGTLKSALELLEYCNADASSTTAALRAKNGSVDPYAVRVWCLGNEMDGPWQLGHKTADDYGRVASDVARGMRMVDPSLELVVCGSSYRSMPSFATWEQAVLEHSYDLVDHLSMHAYYENYGDLQEFLMSSADLDAYIGEAAAVADSVRARKRTDKVMNLALDEYNVWYLSNIQKREIPSEWQMGAPLSEEDYTVADAVVLGNMLVTILQHADRVKVACLAQLVNTIATIRADPGTPAWRQTTFYPFSLTAKYARGEALMTRVSCEDISTGKHGSAKSIDAVTTIDPETGEVAIFIINRSASDVTGVSIDLRGFGELGVVEQVELTDADPLRVNSPAAPEAVKPAVVTGWTCEQSVVRTSVKAASWNMLRLRSA